MSAPEAPRAGRALVRLRAGRERPIRGRHPWVFSGSVAAEEGDPEAALAEVVGPSGEELGVGLYSPGSRIRVRMVAAPREPIDRPFFARRLTRALELRRRLIAADTDGYRLVNSEGDGLPGWTIDRFGGHLVSQITSHGLERLRDDAYAALAELLPGCSLLHRGDLAARRREGLPQDDQWLLGEPPGDEVWFRENGLRFAAELAGGQKTGFYCDQRENRSRVEELADGQSVLDLFAHGGAFSLYALRGGARRVMAVESAERLLDRARRQIEANGLDPRRAELVKDDVFRHLRQLGEWFDLVVCDPPPLARRAADVERAARAYKDLNRLALGRVSPGGFLFTFSCSAAVDGKLFRQILFAAAAEAAVEVQLLAPLAAAADHPVSVFHPEGEYLKGWLARVVGAV